jgi:hypothetical protein
MGTYYVEVSYYRNPFNPAQRDHWSLFVSGDGLNGTIYEATGGTLQMKYNQKANVTITKSTTYQGKVCIGNITAQQLETLNKTLPEVPLPSSPMKVAPGYRRRDCQDWVRDAVKALVGAGVLTEQANQLLDTIPSSN